MEASTTTFPTNEELVTYGGDLICAVCIGMADAFVYPPDGAGAKPDPDVLITPSEPFGYQRMDSQGMIVAKHTFEEEMVKVIGPDRMAQIAIPDSVVKMLPPRTIYYAMEEDMKLNEAIQAGKMGGNLQTTIDIGLIRLAVRKTAPAHERILFDLLTTGDWRTISGAILMSLAYLRTQASEVRFMGFVVREARAPIETVIRDSILRARVSSCDRAELERQVAFRTNLYMDFIVAVMAGVPSEWTLDSLEDDCATPALEFGMCTRYRALASDLASFNDDVTAVDPYDRAEVADSHRRRGLNTINRGLALFMMMARFDFRASNWGATENQDVVYSLSGSMGCLNNHYHHPDFDWLKMAAQVFPQPYTFYEASSTGDRSEVARRAATAVSAILSALESIDGETLEAVWERVPWASPSPATTLSYEAPDQVAYLAGMAFHGDIGNDSINAFDLSFEDNAALVKRVQSALVRARAGLEGADARAGIDDIIAFLQSVDTQWDALVAYTPPVSAALLAPEEFSDVMSASHTPRLFGLNTYEDLAGIADQLREGAARLAEAADVHFRSAASPDAFVLRDDPMVRAALSFMYTMASVHLQNIPLADEDPLPPDDIHPVWYFTRLGDITTLEQPLYREEQNVTRAILHLQKKAIDAAAEATAATTLA